MPSSAALGLKLHEARAEHGAWLTAHKTADGYDMSAEEVGEFNTRMKAIEKLQGEFETAAAIEKSASETEAKLAPQGRIVKDDGQPEHKGPRRLETKEHFDAAFKSAFDANRETLDRIAKGGRGSFSFDLPTDLKTTILTTVHAPQADRLADAGSALYYGDVEDLFPHGRTTSKSVDYFIQTTDTDNTAFVAEATAPTDSAFAWTLTTDPVETVSSWIPMTHEAISDNVGLQSTVTGYLARRLQKLSNQVMLSGTGVTPIPTGVYIRTGFQTQAKGADPAFDAIFKAITKVEVTGDATVDAITIHPTDWQNIRLTRTIDGVYIFGNPANSADLALWGIRVRKTIHNLANGNAGTAGVGAFADWAEVVEREGLTVEVSTEHSTFFTERKVAILLYRRFAVADRRPSAFCTVTGL